MWQCVKCRTMVEADFEVCWKCGTSREGEEDPDFRQADEIPGSEPHAESSVEESTAIRITSADHAGRNMDPEDRPFDCLRCGRSLAYVGTKSFHEGFQWGGVFGDLGQFFVNQETFDVYVCQRCGRVDFYVTGLGGEMRPRE